MERVELLKQLEERDINNLYIIYGQETFLIEELQDKFKSLLDPNMIDFNLSVIDGKETNLEEFRSSIETLPFIDEKRITLVKDFELLSGKKKNFSDSDEEELVNILNNISETTVLVFINNGSIDKKRKFYKNIEKISLICELKKLDDFSLLNWVRAEFQKKNGKINNADLAYFIEMSGYKDKNAEMTLSDIEKEVSKLCSYADGELIKKDDIRNLMTSKIENDIFKLVDMIGSKNANRSYKILRDMLDSGESILGIFAMLYRQFINISKIKTLQESKIPNNIIMDQLNMKPYVFKKVSNQARHYDEISLFSIINYISEYDYKIKNGMIKDSLAAEIFIAKYCN